MSAEKTAVFITGGNRGLGRGLAEAYLARPNHVVIVSVRDPASASAASLKEIKPAAGSSLLVVKIENTSDADAAEAVKTITAAGITALDIVIANAGISGAYSKVDAARIEDVREMLEINTCGPLLLFQAVFPLLKAASERSKSAAPRFLAISSVASSITNLKDNVPFLLGSYGASKAALNYFVRRASFENEWLNAFMIHPGVIQTDMGNAGARHFGWDQAPLPVKDSVEGIISQLDTATLEKSSGKLFNYDGTEMAL